MGLTVCFIRDFISISSTC